jgi:two-component system, NtrC family, response regulator AtoC
VDSPADLIATHSIAPRQEATSEAAYLLVVEASSSRWLPLPKEGAVLIGRGEEADLVLSDSGASRRHARIIISAGQVRVADLDSRNGTKLNGETVVGARAMASGDVVTIGDATMVLRCRRGPPPARVLLDAATLPRRLEEELARAVATDDALAVAVITFAEPADQAAVAGLMDPILRIIDVAAWTSPTELVLLLPGLETPAAEPLGTQLARALDPTGGKIRVGLAAHPADGEDGDALLARARSLATRASAGAINDSESSARLALGDRSIIVADPAMVGLFGLIRRLAPSDLPVLIRGETGAGKENAAFALHSWSPRAAAPFVAINCAALPETLVESELFGSEKGAFSNSTATKPGLLETAEGGTVFFDELAELPRAIQPKLLRVIETKRVMRLGGTKERALNVRFVAATNRDLDEEVRAGRFREDLLFRLNTAMVVLPPLRDRPSEIAILARLFLGQACERLALPRKTLSTGAIHELVRHSWPGNVRELKNVIEFMAATLEDPVIEPWHLRARLAVSERRPSITSTISLTSPAVARTAPAAPAAPPNPAPDGAATAAIEKRAFVPLADELREIEQRRMTEALESSGWVQTRAAELIGMPLRTFQQKVKLYGLNRPG